MKVQHVLSIVNAMLESLLFGGIIFGWPSLQYILQRTGYFADQCVVTSSIKHMNVTSSIKHMNVTSSTHTCNGTSLPTPYNATSSQKHNMTSLVKNCNMTSSSGLMTSCAQRSTTFTTIFMVTISVFMLSSIPIGYILDRFGTWVCRSVFLTAYVIGFICLVTSQPTTSYLIYPAMILFALGGVALFMANMQVANLAGDAQPLIVTSIVGMFNSAVLTFFCVQVTYEAGLDYTLFLRIMAAFSSIMILNTFLLTPKTRFPPRIYPQYKYGVFEWCGDVNGTMTSSEDAPSGEETPLVADRSWKDDDKSFKECLKSPLYWGAVYTLTLLNLQSVFFIGTLVNWLGVVVGGEHTSHYLSVYNIFTLLGAVVSPIDGLLIAFVIKLSRNKTNEIATYSGLFVSALSISIFATAFGISVLLKTPYVSFVLVLFQRSFLFGGTLAFLTILFPVQHYGKLDGVANTFVGVLNFAQYGLFQLVVKYDPTYTVTNLIVLVLAVSTFINPAIHYWNLRKMTPS